MGVGAAPRNGIGGQENKGRVLNPFLCPVLVFFTGGGLNRSRSSAPGGLTVLSGFWGSPWWFLGCSLLPGGSQCSLDFGRESGALPGVFGVLSGGSWCSPDFLGVSGALPSVLEVLSLLSGSPGALQIFWGGSGALPGVFWGALVAPSALRIFLGVSGALPGVFLGCQELSPVLFGPLPPLSGAVPGRGLAAAAASASAKALRAASSRSCRRRRFSSRRRCRSISSSSS